MDNLKKIGVPVGLYAYAIILGASYVFAFWRPYSFSAFPYLSVSDLIFSPLDALLVFIAPSCIVVAMVAFWDNASAFVKRDALLAILLGSYLYVLFGAYDVYKLASSKGIEFDNENSIFSVAGFLFVIAVAISIYQKVNVPCRSSWLAIMACIFLAQVANCLLLGYSRGAAYKFGVSPAYYLVDRQLCAVDDEHEWVFLAKYSSATIFMNTVDRRLCLIGNKNYSLALRSVVENRNEDFLHAPMRSN